MLSDDEEADVGLLSDGSHDSTLVQHTNVSNANDMLDVGAGAKRKSSVHSSVFGSAPGSRQPHRHVVPKRNQSNRAILNVGGQRHEILWSKIGRAHV